MTSDTPMTADVVVLDSAAIVRLRGEIDLLNHDTLRAALLAARAESTHLTIDLAELVFIDAIGGGLILGAVNEVRARGGTVALTGARPPVRRLMFLLGLERYLVG